MELSRGRHGNAWVWYLELDVAPRESAHKIQVKRLNIKTLASSLYKLLYHIPGSRSPDQSKREAPTRRKLAGGEAVW